MDSLHFFHRMELTDLLYKVAMKISKPCSITTLPLSKLSSYPLANDEQHKRIVGALKYVTMTCPDIAYSVNKLLQFMHNPTDVHLIGVN